MYEEENWEMKFSKEILLAKNSRKSGNEGRARVCARRAAGIVAGKYLTLIQPRYKIKGALDNLSYLESYPEVPASIKDKLNLFLIHVDYDHNLPVDVDLIKEAIELKDKLFLLFEQTYE
jgi:hypothetical protein